MFCHSTCDAAEALSNREDVTIIYSINSIKETYDHQGFIVNYLSSDNKFEPKFP